MTRKWLRSCGIGGAPGCGFELAARRLGMVFWSLGVTFPSVRGVSPRRVRGGTFERLGFVAFVLAL